MIMSKKGCKENKNNSMNKDSGIPKGYHEVIYRGQKFNIPNGMEVIFLEEEIPWTVDGYYVDPICKYAFCRLDEGKRMKGPIL